MWLGLAILLAPSPDTLSGQDPFSLTPLIPGFGLGGIGLAAVFTALSPSLRRAIAAASLPALVGVQLYRVIGLLSIRDLLHNRVDKLSQELDYVVAFFTSEGGGS